MIAGLHLTNEALPMEERGTGIRTDHLLMTVALPMEEHETDLPSTTGDILTEEEEIADLHLMTVVHQTVEADLWTGRLSMIVVLQAEQEKDPWRDPHLMNMVHRETVLCLTKEIDFEAAHHLITTNGHEMVRHLTEKARVTDRLLRIAAE